MVNPNKEGSVMVNLLDRERMLDLHEDEEWRTLAEFPHYLISSYGRVRHQDRTYPRRITVNERGFPVILLSSATSATRYLRQINKLVATTFLPTPAWSDTNSVWHKDGDLSNCHVDNLMWERRDRVLEWNEMHRRGEPQYDTPPVMNNRTGEVYKDAYDCAMQEGILESTVVWRIENQANGVYDESARYRYVPNLEMSGNLR
jgi:NUMOD4 motif